MGLSPAQRHSVLIATEAKLKQRQALDSSESMHVMAAALEKVVEVLHGLALAQKVAIKRDIPTKQSKT
jgi:hypothetical protein